MVLRLGGALGVPVRERNELLRAAGLPVAYPVRELSDVDLAPFRAAIDRILTAHLPYPGLVVDSRWNVLLANPACAALYGGDIAGANMVRRFFADPAASAVHVVNWPQVAWAAVARLRHQVTQSPFDTELGELAALAERAVSGLPRPDETDREPVVCPWFRVGDQVVRTIGMAVRFDPATDVTLDELRVELTYPYDEVAERVLRQLHDASGVG
jgi:MmyB-like transcription regulator ligand binding domain